MAEFTAQGNRLDKYDDIVLFPWSSITVNPQDGPARQQTNASWNHEVQSFSYTNGGMDVVAPPTDLSDIEGDLVIMGHGNYGDRIAKDVGYTHSARSLARLLEDSQLPKAYAGKVIVWSCFSAAPGGIAQMLAFKLSCRGYLNVAVWGCRWVTGVTVNRCLTCRANTTMANIEGVTAEATLTDVVRF